MEVRTFPRHTTDLSEPLATLSRDAQGVWWLTVGGVVMHPATQEDHVLLDGGFPWYPPPRVQVTVPDA